MPISALVSGKRHVVSRENRPRCYFSLYISLSRFVRAAYAAETFDLSFRSMHSFPVACLTNFIKRYIAKQMEERRKSECARDRGRFPSGGIIRLNAAPFCALVSACLFIRSFLQNVNAITCCCKKDARSKDAIIDK